jgi:hypothetical protein
MFSKKNSNIVFRKKNYIVVICKLQIVAYDVFDLNLY